MTINRNIEKRMAEISVQLSAEDNLHNVCHMRWHGEPLPSQDYVRRIMELFRAIIFPGFFGEPDINHLTVEAHTRLNITELYTLLCNQLAAGLCFTFRCEQSLDLEAIHAEASTKAMAMIERLPELRRILETDVTAIFRGDPAARDTEEVLYCYPGLRAICAHRIAHELVMLEIPVIPRMISELTHGETGIDIHPGASIGEGFMIDHGTGIVIGATTIIGRNVKIYQGVTLGARSFPTDENNDPVKGLPRHPIIGNNVVIYANATILGRVNIGDGAVIGGNVWLTEDVAPGQRVVQNPAATVAVIRQ